MSRDNAIAVCGALLSLSVLTADRILNMDETGFVIAPKIQKIFAIEGARQVHNVSHGIVPTISFAGDYTLLELELPKK
ncbi:8148_t:CDS:2 [Ambispora gerdemannii]|uniref:8148_t:CDS:1 n=1 Tax=Ambispora gerdemannii TaxID=144530 RepID=A0A9N8ZER9_9GLOM|nr:8148_t:CDS:2 [Ambispora gerdemannii]